MSKGAMKVETGPTPPFRESDSSAVEWVEVPMNRRALFLALEAETLHDNTSDELAFCALRPCDRSLLQLLLYLTYCCKGQLLQVTLENTDFSSMSPPVREDFAHGRLFCFVLDMSVQPPPDHGPSDSFSGVRSQDQNLPGSQALETMGAHVNMSVFGQDDLEPLDYMGPRSPPPFNTRTDKELREEAYKAFMRLQLVRQKAISLNNAMIAMRDERGELSPAFEWLDIRTDTLNAGKLDRKKIREFQGSMYTPVSHTGKQAVVLPESISDLSLKSVDKAVGEIADSASKGEGKDLLDRLVSKLTVTAWREHRVLQRYNPNISSDSRFLADLKAFAQALDDSSSLPGVKRVSVGKLMVFKYSLEKLIDRESPDRFLCSMLHRHMPVPTLRIAKALREIRSKRRTRALADMLSRCRCPPRAEPGHDKPCLGNCQTAYACFYNSSEQHPFSVSRETYTQYFAHLYPHLGKLERLSAEMKAKYGGRRQFESIADMVFNVLVKHQASDGESLYAGLPDLMDDKMRNSCLSLGRALPNIHRELCLRLPVRADDCSEDLRSLNPAKVYDHSLVRYLFSDSLQVGRLFQASTTFNYIVTNTAPRYTIERVMLFNITGPGEGKSYANNVLNLLFRRVKGCIETLTSFTPQAFKYKRQRNACVVIIDDAHITHEKNVKALDKESNVIPNTFKNLLDTSVLESDVVSRDMNSGKVDTVRYHAVHNCGFVWNTNTLGFVSQAWADRCLIMESEFPGHVTQTRGTKQLQDEVEEKSMDRVAALCLYRQNLVQSATMIAESHVMQFGSRFDEARDACVASLHAGHIVCTGAVSRRASFCINQLVFAEAMKLACHFVFDVWVPPWTKVPDQESFPDLGAFMVQLNRNRLEALDKLSFGQVCLETNAVYKLCAAACLPDICPRVMDAQGRFACQALGYVLGQIHGQGLKTSIKDGSLCVSGIESVSFPEKEFKGGNESAHEMLQLCSSCRFPARSESGSKSHRLCTHKCMPYHQNAQHSRRGEPRPKKVSSVIVPLEVVYDMLALYAPDSHAGFWDQLVEAMLGAYEEGELETKNAFGQSLTDQEQREDDQGECNVEDEEDWDTQTRVKFSLDFNQDPIRSLVLEATTGVEPLKELTFNKCALGGEVFRCTAPLYYGGVLARACERNPPRGSYEARHVKESEQGPEGTFHGPRLGVYSEEYSGLPVKNASSFCTTRTVYHQDKILLRRDRGPREPLVELEQDWEWLEASDVFNKVHGHQGFSPESLKRDYAVTMTVVKGEPLSREPRRSRRLVKAMRVLRHVNGSSALEMRKGVYAGSDPGPSRMEERETHVAVHHSGTKKRAGKRTSPTRGYKVCAAKKRTRVAGASEGEENEVDSGTVLSSENEQNLL